MAADALLKAAVALQLVGVAFGQTIVVDGTEVAATRENVDPLGDRAGWMIKPHEEVIQLTETALANLTDLQLTDVSLLYFGDEGVARRSEGAKRCKTFPGDEDWPKDITWRMLNIVTDGALIETVPIGASCYDNFGVYDAGLCQDVTDQFTNSSLHLTDPSSVMAPIYQGLTCQPTEDRSGECTLGGFPSYVIDASTVTDVQIAVNFARNNNLRLIVKNTGHDFNGRSVGAGALSIWTHRFKTIEYYETFKTDEYEGPAFKVGAGVIGFELYEAAEEHGATAVGGEGLSVGYAGGYLAGGGHSPMSPKYGLAADSILSIDVVKPNGRFFTVDKNHQPELFWALSGGGGSTFGVAISYTVKVYPKTKASVMSFSFGTSKRVSHEAFWEAVRAYVELIPMYDSIGNYEYWNIWHGEGDDLSFNMVPWFAPGLSLRELQEVTSPLFAKWESLGIRVKPVASEHESYYGAWKAGFPREIVGGTVSKTAARLFPKKNWDDEAMFNTTFDALRGLSEKGGQVIGFGISTGEGPHPDNGANPHWHDAALFAISVINWPLGSSAEVMAEESRRLTNDWMQPWRDAAPDSGSYASESDVTEPDFKYSFYGAKYDRLLAHKDKVDPWGLLYTLQGVGSDRWYITGQLDGFPTQNGRLCPV